MYWSRSLAFLVAFAFLLGCSPRTSEESFHVSFDSPQDLREYLKWTEDRVALVAAHRGGPEPGYPENCIPTFENALRYAPCLVECDVRMSRDSVLVMIHDESLDRTTTGAGSVSDHTLGELQELELKDNEGVVTPYVIPTLSEVLTWAQGKAIVELDVKRPVPPESIVTAIEEHGAEAYSVVITYSTPSALRYHELNPDLMISASARDMEGTRRLLSSGISPSNLMAFVGVYEPSDSLYALLHAHGIRAILGTMGNLDRRAETRGPQVYSELLQNGADVLATDRVPLAAEAIIGHPD